MKFSNLDFQFTQLVGWFILATMLFLPTGMIGSVVLGMFFGQVIYLVKK